MSYLTNDDLFGAYSATSYWSDTDVEIHDDKVTTVTINERRETLTEDNEWREEYSEPIILRQAALEKAAKRIVDEQLAHSSIIGYIAQRDIDADALDVIIQVAVFGEIVYG